MWVNCRAFEAIAALGYGLRVQSCAPHTFQIWTDVFLLDGKQGIYYDFNGKALRIAAPGTMTFRREVSDDHEIEEDITGERGIEQRVREFLAMKSSKKKTAHGKGQGNKTRI